MEQCDFCEEWIHLNSIVRHKTKCKHFYQSMKKAENGYECTICTANLTGRGSMYGHLEEIHGIGKSEGMGSGRLHKNF